MEEDIRTHFIRINAVLERNNEALQTIADICKALLEHLKEQEDE